MVMNRKLQELKDSLFELHKELRKTSFQKFKRINPFYEDIIDWKERGEFWCVEDKNVTIYNSTTVVGDVNIGENTWIGPFCSLDGNGKLTIGKNCSISAGVQILTHDTVVWALTGGKQLYEYDSVTIGDCCFIGTHAIITKGVTIGSHCIIGAGAVVTKNVSSNSIVVGVPGKIIGKTIINNDDTIAFRYFNKNNNI
jgi:acetyltransferase-like isoleucine patch superfamily enzyme